MSANHYDQDDKTNHKDCWSGMYRGQEMWWFDVGSPCKYPRWQELEAMTQ